MIELLIPIPVCNKELLDAQEIICSPRGWTTHVQDIPAYVNTYFNLAIIAGIVVFAFIAIVSGFQILLSSLNFIQTKKVTSRLKHSGIGLITLIFSWVILYQISPNLTDVKISKIGEISELGCCQLTGKEEFYWMKETTNEENELTYACDAGDKKVDVLKCSAVVAAYTEGEEDVGGLPAAPGNLVNVQGTNIIVSGGPIQVTRETLTMLQTAASSGHFRDAGISLIVTSGYRSYDDQQKLITKNCPPAQGLTWSDPRRSSDCKPATALNQSAHNLGKAIDVWGSQNGKVCVVQSQCNQSSPANDPCRQNQCQAKVIEVLQYAGFCNLSIESWHFESEKISKACTTMPDYAK